MGADTERDELPRLKDFARSPAETAPASRPDEDAQYRAMVLETTFLLPFGVAMLTGVGVFLGPYLLGRLMGPAADLTRLERCYAWTGSHVWLTLGLAGLVCALVLVAVRTELARQTFRSLGSAAPLAFKLVLFLPIVGAVALLLLSIVTPVLKALSGLS